MDAREELMRVALRLLAEQGYAAVGLREVAAEAGVTTGSIYHHFTGKEDLFRAAVEHHADLVLAEQKVQLSMRAPAADRLLAVADGLAPRSGRTAAWERDFSVVLHVQLRKMAGFDDVYRKLRRSFERLIREPIREGVESGELHLPEGASIDDMAAVVQGGLVGLLQMHSQGALRVPLDRALRLHVSSVTRVMVRP